MDRIPPTLHKVLGVTPPGSEWPRSWSATTHSAWAAPPCCPWTCQAGVHSMGCGSANPCSQNALPPHLLAWSHHWGFSSEFTSRESPPGPPLLNIHLLCHFQPKYRFCFILAIAVGTVLSVYVSVYLFSGLSTFPTGLWILCVSGSLCHPQQLPTQKSLSKYSGVSDSYRPLLLGKNMKGICSWWVGIALFNFLLGNEERKPPVIIMHYST